MHPGKVISLLTLLLMILPVTSPAADKDTGKATTPPAPAQQEKPPAPKPAPPATTFTPSEKIKADSAIAFPVDI